MAWNIWLQDILRSGHWSQATSLWSNSSSLATTSKQWKHLPLWTVIAHYWYNHWLHKHYLHICHFLEYSPASVFLYLLWSCFLYISVVLRSCADSSSRFMGPSIFHFECFGRWLSWYPSRFQSLYASAFSWRLHIISWTHHLSMFLHAPCLDSSRLSQGLLTICCWQLFSLLSQRRFSRQVFRQEVIPTELAIGQPETSLRIHVVVSTSAPTYLTSSYGDSRDLVDPSLICPEDARSGAYRTIARTSLQNWSSIALHHWKSHSIWSCPISCQPTIRPQSPPQMNLPRR